MMKDYKDLLKEIYRYTGSDTSKQISTDRVFQLADNLGFSRHVSRDLIRVLMNNNYIKPDTSGNFLITPKGITEATS
jgi:hypothetical protein